MLRQVSGFAGVLHHLPCAVGRLEPRHDGRQLLGLLPIGRRDHDQRRLQHVHLAPFDRPAASARRICGASFASLTLASMDSWLMRAFNAAVSSVMKFCATQPLGCRGCRT